MKTNLTINEISKTIYDLLTERGYSPDYTDSYQLGFECMICDKKFSFYPIEDEVFGFSAEFNLKQAPSESERERLERIFMLGDPEDCIFENLHIDGSFACISSAFTTDLYSDVMPGLIIETLESPEGIAAELFKLEA